MKKIITSTLCFLTILSASTAFAQASKKSELVKINWPTSEKWHVADKQQNEAQTMIELLKGTETFENFTEIGTTYNFRGDMYVPVTQKMEELTNRVKNLAPTAIMTMIEKDEKAACPWYIYKIESPTESQVWHAVQGKTEIQVSFWATRTPAISAVQQSKWVKIFKSATVHCN